MPDQTRKLAPRKLGIVAGSGPLPIALAEDALSAGRDVFIIGIEGEASPDISRYPHDWCRIGALGRFISLLKDNGCEDVVLIGPIHRPDIRKVMPDAMGLRLLPRFVSLMRKGDDGLLKGIIALLEQDHGFRVIGAHEVSESLLAPQGPLGRLKPDDEQKADIEIAIRAVLAIGALDIGQGAVAVRGIVLALEAAEGTDAMLARLDQIAPALRGTVSSRAGVLVKLAKPGQERRIDLPTIGVKTVEGAAAAGLAGIAVEAGNALISDALAVARAADKAGLFVVGLSADEIAHAKP